MVRDGEQSAAGELMRLRFGGLTDCQDQGFWKRRNQIPRDHVNIPTSGKLSAEFTMLNRLLRLVDT
jgi:hypothetical protein